MHNRGIFIYHASSDVKQKEDYFSASVAGPVLARLDFGHRLL